MYNELDYNTLLSLTLCENFVRYGNAAKAAKLIEVKGKDNSWTTITVSSYLFFSFRQYTIQRYLNAFALTRLLVLCVTFAPRSYQFASTVAWRIQHRIRQINECNMRNLLNSGYIRAKGFLNQIIPIATIAYFLWFFNNPDISCNGV